jgi:hypothetical protein
MLNYLIAMQRTWLFLALVCLLLPVAPSRVFARQENPTPPPATTPAGLPTSGPAILAPLAGEALQGIVRITARVGGENIQSAEIAFAYAGDATGAWFLIDERSQPPAAATPIEWDTSRITDGDYTLRLLVTYTDGSQQTVQTTGLRVRNYTPVETNTPAPAAPAAVTATPDAAASGITPAATQAVSQPTQAQVTPATPTPSPAPASPPAPTAAPRNPAALPTGMVWFSAARGALAALGVFALVGLYDLLRRLGRR